MQAVGESLNNPGDGRLLESETRYAELLKKYKMLSRSQKNDDGLREVIAAMNTHDTYARTVHAMKPIFLAS